MEELQSTEVLEREILEDSRKKALRILKTAEGAIQAKNTEWEKRTSSLINELEEKYSEEIKLTTEKLMARLPIDKLRSRIEKIETLLHSSVENWYHSLSKEQVLDLLKTELLDRLALNEEFTASAKKLVFYHGLDLKDVKTVLNTITGDFTVKEAASVSLYPSIILETENVRIIASIENIIDYYLLEKREELIEAMLGRAFTEDA
jgi:V/A-type H+-transporting ATPase subunit E